MGVVTELNVLFTSGVGWARGYLLNKPSRAYFLKTTCLHVLMETAAYISGKVTEVVLFNAFIYFQMPYTQDKSRRMKH